MVRNANKHIWEGWTVQDFIDELEITFDLTFKVAFSSFYKPTTKEELKKWCMSEQPYYKKHIPEVYEYFLNKMNLQ